MRHIETAAATFALVVALIGGTIGVETRYAKSSDIRAELNEYYSRNLQIRILELQLKPASSFTNSDKALLEFLQQELRKINDH